MAISFRREAVEYAISRLEGEVVLKTKIAWFFLTLFIATLILCFILILNAVVIPKTIEGIGEVVSGGQFVRIRSDQSGIVTAVQVTEGDQITAGEPLIRIAIAPALLKAKPPTKLPLTVPKACASKEKLACMPTEVTSVRALVGGNLRALLVSFGQPVAAGSTIALVSPALASRYVEVCIRHTLNAVKVGSRVSIIPSARAGSRGVNQITGNVAAVRQGQSKATSSYNQPILPPKCNLLVVETDQLAKRSEEGPSGLSSGLIVNVRVTVAKRTALTWLVDAVDKEI